MKRKKWCHSIGKRPNRVTVFERVPGGVLYVRLWDPSLRKGLGNFRRYSLGHKDRDRARAHAAELHARLMKGEDERRVGRITLARLFALYAEHRTPKKKPTEQEADARRIEMFTRFLGADKDPSKLTRREWERFIDERREGGLCPHGARGSHRPLGKSEKPCPGPRGRAVRDRTVEADLRWLIDVLNWGSKWQDRDGRYLLAGNPARGFHVPREKNIRRPVATPEQYEALRGASEGVMMELRDRGHRDPARSYLSEILDLAHWTGRRISAVLGLRFEDLHLERTPTAPHGAITWPANTDKKGREWERIPVTAEARAAIDRIMRERAGVGSLYLFPAPGDTEKPVHRRLATAWLHKAAQFAAEKAQENGQEFAVPKGWGWHAFRRKAATEMKGSPDKDVMALLGWSDLRSLKDAYQHADSAGMLATLQNRRKLSEAR